ncbi:hypothetical protein EI427_05615 [Flammeovirga pectinis]|uniref:Uncharacterized protein n=1 Tax=Flammeovirga pectinis TaxID=2494373 RepID=A0A3S9P0L6_9BACT|nr:hypothetical protein [Flammeovirga pectinis]AZQ61729.1 hypothetical protein EI427_05615 [Flammeovirga pectinis]
MNQELIEREIFLFDSFIDNSINHFDEYFRYFKKYEKDYSLDEIYQKLYSILDHYDHELRSFFKQKEIEGYSICNSIEDKQERNNCNETVSKRDIRTWFFSIPFRISRYNGSVTIQFIDDVKSSLNFVFKIVKGIDEKELLYFITDDKKLWLKKEFENRINNIPSKLNDISDKYFTEDLFKNEVDLLVQEKLKTLKENFSTKNILPSELDSYLSTYFLNKKIAETWLSVLKKVIQNEYKIDNQDEIEGKTTNYQELIILDDSNGDIFRLVENTKLIEKNLNKLFESEVGEKLGNSIFDKENKDKWLINKLNSFKIYSINHKNESVFIAINWCLSQFDDCSVRYEHEIRQLTKITTNSVAENLNVPLGSYVSRIPITTDKSILKDRFINLYAQRWCETLIRNMIQINPSLDEDVLSSELSKIDQFIEKAKQIDFLKAINVNQIDMKSEYEEFIRMDKDFYSNPNHDKIYSQVSGSFQAQIYGKYVLFRKWLEERLKSKKVDCVKSSKENKETYFLAVLLNNSKYRSIREYFKTNYKNVAGVKVLTILRALMEMNIISEKIRTSNKTQLHKEISSFLDGKVVGRKGLTGSTFTKIIIEEHLDPNDKVRTDVDDLKLYLKTLL